MGLLFTVGREIKRNTKKKEKEKREKLPLWLWVLHRFTMVVSFHLGLLCRSTKKGLVSTKIQCI
jgi:hypothetical protein